MLSHDVPVDADQLHPAWVVTVADAVTPLAGAARLAGPTAKLHGADCAMVAVCPAIVTAAVRAEAVVLTLTLRLTLPFALPLAPISTVAHDALLDALHAQPEPAVTAMAAEPPEDASVCEAGEIA